MASCFAGRKAQWLCMLLLPGISFSCCAISDVCPESTGMFGFLVIGALYKMQH